MLRPAIAVAAATVLAACSPQGSRNPLQQRIDAFVSQQDASRGPALIRTYGCGSCHSIDGIRGADGKVGPPLTQFRKRVYVGGVVPNTPANLARWIADPKSVDPRTAMPDMGVKPDEAKDIAAWLYTHRRGG